MRGNPRKFRALGFPIWLRAEPANITLNGGDVSTWIDATGTGNSLTQGTGANQPLWVAARVNSQPCVEFTAANSDRLAKANVDLIGASSYTLFMAYKVRNVPTQGGYFCNDVTTRLTGISYGTLGSAGGGGTFKNINHDGLAGHEVGGAEDTNAKVVSIRFNVTSGAIDSQVNGADVSTTNQPGAAILAPSASAVIAVGSGPTAANFSDLDCYEVFVHQAAASDSVRARETAYVRARLAL